MSHHRGWAKAAEAVRPLHGTGSAVPTM